MNYPGSCNLYCLEEYSIHYNSYNQYDINIRILVKKATSRLQDTTLKPEKPVNIIIIEVISIDIRTDKTVTYYPASL